MIMMKMGIEHEFVFKDDSETYLDFEMAEYSIFQKIIDEFPYFENDDTFFDCKSLEQKPKRCYVEGFERYDINGQLTETVPKGLEIRTLPHTTVDAVIKDFINSYTYLMLSAEKFGFSPLLTSLHPFKNSVHFNEPLNKTEMALRTEDELNIATNALLWHGIHINVSMSNTSKEQMMDLLQKVNYYVPYIIPFSFSSPFYNGKVFDGLSYRTYRKAKTRKVIQLQNRKGVDVLEFRGYDSCGDARLLKSLLLLYKGLLLDKTLTKRALFQDPELLKRSALQGFEDKTIQNEGLNVLEAAKSALQDEGKALQMLENMLYTNDSYASRMKQIYLETGDIMKSISNRYNYV